jgi:transcriptional regulator with XRE-family HTH domain
VASGLTLEQLAIATGVSLAWLSRLERCVVPLSAKTAAVLGPVLRCDPDSLLRGQMALAVETRRQVLDGIALRTLR